jgi:cytochrome P450
VRGLAWAGAERLHGPTFLPGAEGEALRRALAVLDERVGRMIDARRARGLERPDLLTRLLAARDDDGEPMSDRQVRDEVLTLFIAGHETTAAALAWALYELARAPSLYEAVEAEADALSGPPGAGDLPRLALATRVFKEALRKYPPVYLVGRDAVADTELAGARIPRDTNVSFSPYSLHFRPDLWPEPARFEPARFTPEAEAARHRYAYLPFGAGPRVCIGMGFALLEGPLVLATMLRHARFEALGPDEPVASSATLRPRRGVPMRVRLRRAPS